MTFRVYDRDTIEEEGNVEIEVYISWKAFSGGFLSFVCLKFPDYSTWESAQWFPFDSNHEFGIFYIVHSQVSTRDEEFLPGRGG
jgi:hypothetical protein